MLHRRKTHDLLRFSAFVDARTNHLDDALKLAKQIFSQFPKDTYLLSELTNIALTQYQADEIAEELYHYKRSMQDEFLLSNFRGTQRWKGYNPDFGYGHFLFVQAKGEDLELTLNTFTSYSVQLINNDRDLAIQVLDSTGIGIKNAKV